MSDMAEVKRLIEDQGRAWEEYKATNDAIIKAKAEGKAVADLEAKLDRIGAALDDAGKKQSDIEAALTKLNRPGGPASEGDEAKSLAQFNLDRKSAAALRGESVGDVGHEEYAAYKRALDKYLRKGDRGFLNDEVKAMQVGVDSDGGYLVTPDMTGRMVRRLFDMSPIRSIASVQAISSDALEGIEDRDEAAAGWVGETAARSDTGTPTVGKYRIEAMEMYAQPKATQKLLDDAAVNVEAWLGDKVVDKFARLEGGAFCVGNGVGKPQGFAAYTTAATADSSRAWGVLEHISTGVNSDFAASNPADILFDLEMAFKPGYLNNASWVTRRSVIVKVRKFKGSDNNYLWQPGLQAGRPATLIGYPIVMAEDMPALAAASLSMALGDFREGYQIVDRLGVRVLRDPFTDKPYVKFYTTKRTGGAVLNFEAIKFIRFGT